MSTSPRVVTRTPLPAAVGQALTLAWRGLVQVRHDPMELAAVSLQPVVLLLLFTYVLGGAVAGTPQQYLAFGVPGLIVQTTLFATVRTGVGLNFDLSKGIYDRFRSLPIAQSAPLAGRILTESAKHAWSIVLLLGVGTLLGFRIRTGIVPVLAVFVLVLVFCAAVAWLAVLVGVLASEPEKVMAFGYLVVLPLTFASNVFVPATTMPAWLRQFVDLNPVTHLATAIRGLLVGGPVTRPALAVLLWAVGITAVFAPLAVRALRRHR
ncbi:MAG TPA: ABC transporter permease [Micromonosporaceae bacterium]